MKKAEIILKCLTEHMYDEDCEKVLRQIMNYSRDRLMHQIAYEKSVDKTMELKELYNTIDRNFTLLTSNYIKMDQQIVKE